MSEKMNVDIFNTQYKVLAAGLERYLLSLCKCPHTAAELSQQLWIYAFEKLDEKQVKQVGRLYKKAYYLFVDHVRKNKRFVLTDDVMKLVPPCSAKVQPGESDLFFRFWDNFEHLYPPLTYTEKWVFWYKARYGMSYREVSLEMGIPKSTVSDIYHGVRVKCCEYLKREEACCG